MCAVCVTLGKKPDWTTAKQLLADAEFINKLINFNKETLTDKVYTKIKQFSKNPDFNPEIVGKVSIACKSLCSWVLALQTYHEVYRTVKPKEMKVKEANEALELMRTSLKRKENMLHEVTYNHVL
jgi:dynein heavy chain